MNNPRRFQSVIEIATIRIVNNLDLQRDIYSFHKSNFDRKISKQCGAYEAVVNIMFNYNTS